MTHVYEIRPRKDKRGVDLICDVLPFGRLWYGEADDAVGYAEHYSRSTRSKPRFTILTTRLMCSALSRSIHGCKSAIICLAALTIKSDGV